MNGCAAKFTRLLAVLSVIIAVPFARAQKTVTWTGDNMTWTAPDTDSFDDTYENGDDVVFGNAGVGNISVGSGVAPGNITFTHTTGTYGLWSGTSWDAGANRTLSIIGGGTVQFGQLGGVNFHPKWGDTTITGGSRLLYTTSGTMTGGIGQNNGTITINNGTLLVSRNTGVTDIPNPIVIGAAGGRLVGRSAGGDWARNNFTGAISGAGPLWITGYCPDTTIWRGGGPGIYGVHSGFTGAVIIDGYRAGIESPATVPGQFGSNMVRAGSAPASMFPNASSITVRDGGVLAVESAVAANFFDGVIFGPRGGIGATGASGALTAFSNPMQFVGVGGALVLDNYNALLNDRLNDNAVLSLNNNRLHIIGRNANNSPTSETAGALSFSGSSLFTIDRPNSTNSGVKLTVASLGNASTGNTLQLQWGALGTLPSQNTLIVTGSKPDVTNGMITPGIQHFGGGNALGDFMTFSGNDLILATYANYSGDWSGAGATEIVNVTTNVTLSAGSPISVHALRFANGTQNLGNRTIHIGSGGLITTSGTGITNGTLDFGTGPAFIGAYNAAAQATISATINGSGGLTIMGASQTLNITGNNTALSGGIWINGGAVRFSTAGANGQNITINTFGRLVAQASGTDTVGGVSGSGVISGWVASSGSSTGTLEISPSSGTHEFNGYLSNGASGRTLAITKSGAGTQVFGPNSVGTYTGTTSVNAGSLLIHGDFSAATGNVSVAGGATLGGTGIIGGNTTTSGPTAVISPGASAGTLTFNQNLDLSAGATLNFELGTPVTNQDLIVVNGTLIGSSSSDGLQFNFSGLTGFVGYTPYQLFSFNSISGLDYADLTISSSPWPLDTSYGTGGWNITSDALYVQFIPEPGTTGVLMLGVAALWWRRRLRRGP